jgi:hypothetical protein
MAFGLLALAILVCWCSLHPSHAIDKSNELVIVIVSALVSIAFSWFVIISWKRQWVWVRSSRIVRSSDPLSYWVAMTGFVLFALVFLCTFALNCYELFRPSA